VHPTASLPMMTVEELLAHKERIRDIVKRVFIEGEHYGKFEDKHGRPAFPKPILALPGAETLALACRLVLCDVAVIERDHAGGHREFQVTVTLRRADTDRIAARGVGAALTLESQHRWREAKRTCPKCQAATIYRSSKEEAWFCWPAKGGCGQNFAVADPAITSQTVGRIEVPDIADAVPNVLAIAFKRAYVAAVTRATATSDIFAVGPGESDAAGSGPPTEAQGQTIAGYRTRLGDARVDDIVKRLNLPTPATAAGADLLLDTLRAEEEACQKAPGKPVTTTATTAAQPPAAAQGAPRHAPGATPATTGRLV